MGGLIPFLLPSAGSRSSSTSTPTETRRRSCLAQSTTPSSSALSHRRQHSLPSVKQPRRASFVAPAALAFIPYTHSEWKRAIDEVKRKYHARRYRSCSTRCCEILDSINDVSTVEPLHLIYLHFYAASSFEWCARPLSTSSNYRTKLLRDATTHYLEADALINATEENMAGRSRSPFSGSTCSMNSPGLTASSRTSLSSAMSSPRTSLFSLDDDVTTKPSLKRAVKPKKKVSFSGLPEFIEFEAEPYIRPDSPTLGLEGEFFMRSPISPVSSVAEIESKAPARVPLEEVSELEPEETVSEVSSPATEQSEEPDVEDRSPTDYIFDLEVFLQTRSINRIRAQLSALRSQVAWHRDAVDALLAIPDDTPATPSLPSSDDTPIPVPVPAAASTPAPSSSKLARSNTLPLSLRSPRTDPATTSTTNLAEKNLAGYCGARSTIPYNGRPASVMSMESTTSTIRAGGDEDLQQRIERLRAGGWQRKRFDSRRYEALREQVLGELR
ncbi:Uu.00g037920.m01.CDS01 [Anthostomella pinea]|uniref:Uu.00g037920.m01.CDS01 n=1 Tax=Anthostomella pinea TaxID=933095 RepID=A0AAI8YBA1_9PEZI|nr:Uu.00g037920.m01.CDS01 [Anthostomella pinea]